MNLVTLTADASRLDAALSSLSDAAQSFAEFGDALVDFLESGDEIFLLHCDGGAAILTNELVVRFYPSDSLLRFVAAFRARNPDFDFLEHFGASLENKSTGQCVVQFAENV